MFTKELKSTFCSEHGAVKCHWEFVEFGGKMKQYTRIGSLLLLPRNNTQSHDIELVLMWNVKVLQN